jgi:cobalamin biosynthetic protein CobC
MGSDPRPQALTSFRYGDLTAARALFPAAPEPFVDLSTGINPRSYPIPQLPSSVFARLPEAAAVQRLAATAAQAYGAPAAACVVPSTGTQILLPVVAALVSPGRAGVFGPADLEGPHAAALAGHLVAELRALEDLHQVDIAFLSNPNNADGGVLPRATLFSIAEELGQHGGVLVIDEAFMDVGPPGASLAADVERANIVVLRSIGEFFGLAGVRLGFAVAGSWRAAVLAAMLGPWAVSGPAVAIGEAALADAAWASSMRVELVAAAIKLDGLLWAAGLDVVGGTSLFRLVRTPSAPKLFEHLGRAGIFVRRYPEHPTWLRFGLPGPEEAWERLRAALAGAQA